MRGRFRQESRHRRAVWACAQSACVLLACTPEPGGGQNVDRLAPAPYGDLTTLVRDLFIPGADSQKYVVPAAGQLSELDTVITMIEARAFEGATAHAAALGYDLWRLDDPTVPGLAVLAERPATLRGGGTFVVNTARTSAAVIEVPHPLADAATLEEGVSLFLQAHAGALLIAGTHRCAALESTPCVGAEATNACAGRIRVSDAAHFVASNFQTAHETLFRLWPDSAAVSLHAHADSTGEADVIVSEGTRQDLGADAPGNRLRDALRGAGYTASSCNAVADPSPRLCGESNVQGRASNGAADACRLDAAQAGNRFLHVEQSATSLGNPAALATALATSL